MGKGKKRGEGIFIQQDMIEMAMLPEEAASYREEAAVLLMEKGDLKAVWEKIKPNLEDESLRPRPFSFALAAFIMRSWRREKEKEKYLQTAVFDLLRFAKENPQIDRMEEDNKVWLFAVKAVLLILAVLEDEERHRDIYELSGSLSRLLPHFELLDYFRATALFNTGKYAQAARAFKKLAAGDDIFNSLPQVVEMIGQGVIKPFKMRYLPDIFDVHYREMLMKYIKNPLLNARFLDDGTFRILLLAFLFEPDSRIKEARKEILKNLKYTPHPWAQEFYGLIQSQKGLSQMLAPVLKEIEEEYKIFPCKGSWPPAALTPRLVALIPHIKGKYPGIAQDLEKMQEFLLFLEEDGASFSLLEEFSLFILEELIDITRETGRKNRKLEELYRDYYDYDPASVFPDFKLYGPQGEDGEVSYGMIFSMREEGRRQVEDRFLTGRITVKKIYRNMPYEWTRTACILNELPVKGRREERQKDLENLLASEEGLDRVLKKLDANEKKILKLLLESGCLMPVLDLEKGYGYSTCGDSYAEENIPSISPLGRLWLKGLIAIGRDKGKLYPAKIAVIPEDLRERLKGRL